MTISEIQQLENSRKSPDTFGRIHFIKEGNFYRAHDISAWLITMMPFSEAIKNVSIIAKKKYHRQETEGWIYRRIHRFPADIA